jgi:hypothetical protein
VIDGSVDGPRDAGGAPAAPTCIAQLIDEKGPRRGRRQRRGSSETSRPTLCRRAGADQPVMRTGPSTATTAANSDASPLKSRAGVRVGVVTRPDAHRG